MFFVFLYFFYYAVFSTAFNDFFYLEIEVLDIDKLLIDSIKQKKRKEFN